MSDLLGFPEILTPLIDIKKPINSFTFDKECFFVLSTKDLMKYQKDGVDPITYKKLFEKDGSTRKLMVDNDFLYCKDFIIFHILDKYNLDHLKILSLGSDLKSDICGISVDEKNIYACIRNGSIAVIRKTENFEPEYFNVSSSSIWSIKTDSNFLYAGNVEGNLLKIDKKSMETSTLGKFNKSNLRSVMIDESNVITASQDKGLILWNKEDLNIKQVKKKAHEKMFDVIGTWNDSVLTACFTTGEVKFWSLQKLDLELSVRIPICYPGEATIDDDRIYLSSKSINGLLYANLNDLKEYLFN